MSDVVTHKAALRDTALFLDRDGTIIVDEHYASDPRQVVLVAGAAEAITSANTAQIPVVIVTNQSGIGRGLITEQQYHAVHDRMVALLTDAGAHIDGVYFCPHAPDLDGQCPCRKPGIGMYQQAAHDLQLSLDRSTYVGDRFRDVAPALATGGLGILVPSSNTPAADVAQARSHSLDGICVASTIRAAVNDALTHLLSAT